MPLDADDIERLYDRHAIGVLAFFARRTYDPEAAVDLMAETFAAAFEDRGQFRGSSHDQAAAWLFAIARNQLAERYRRGRVERRALERLGVDRRALTEHEYERIEELAGLAELRDRLAEGLAVLSDGQREALRLRVIEERPYPDVAATLGVSEQTARARVSRGLRALRATTARPDAEEAPDHA